MSVTFASRLPDEVPMLQRLARPTFLLTLSLIAGLAVACSDDPTGPDDGSPLDGLIAQAGRDSVGNPVPPPPTNPGNHPDTANYPPPPANPVAGGFHGTVLGPSTPGQGVDTLATAPRVAGVVVSAYKILGGTTAEPDLGPVEQSVTTGADGKFALSLSGGHYLVTFTPPANGIYGGVWVTSTTSANSNDWPWWVILWKK
jgi:hypothetical protein